MTKNLTKLNTKQYNLSLNQEFLQLKMNLNTEMYIKDDGKVGLLRNLIERMDTKQLVDAYSSKGRKPAVNPVIMLQILILCYSEGIYSSRKIENACNYDLRIRYLLDGITPPDHATINRYRQRLEPILENLLHQFTEILIEEKHIDLSSIYIDGTKIEAYANKYTFVWRKSIEKFQEKLRRQIIEYFSLPEVLTAGAVKEIVKRKLDEVSELAKDIIFVNKQGKRKTQIQRDYEMYKDWHERLVKYENHLLIMGERNSYSKTDHDATFMRMKDDHMRNGQLKPAYNIQLASTGQFIIGVYGSHHPSDMYTLPLFLDKLMPKYEGKLERIVCDAGYESIENYTYLKENNLESYIKPSNYDQSKKRKYKKDISLRENMKYHEEEDYYECANGKKLLRGKDTYRVRKSGFKETIRVYKCEECNNCPYQKQCNKYSKKENPQTKSLFFNYEFNEFRKQSHANITSEEGIDERINRSIQAEGMFSKIKEGLSYTRFRHRGLKNVMSDMYLIILGLNLNTLLNKLKNNQTEVIKYKKAA